MVNMSKEEIRKHRLSGNKSLISVVLVTLLMMFGYFFMSQTVCGFIVSVPVVLLFGDGTIDDKLKNTALMENAATTTAIFASIALLFFYYHWFKPEFNRKIRKSLLSWKLIMPILIYWIAYYGVTYTVVSGNFTFGIPTYSSAVAAVAAGVCEEIAFRAVGISYMKRQRKGEKHILPILLFTSVTFGLTHIINAIKGGNVGGHCIQALLATMLGIFFGAVYLRTGNILPCIVMHGLHDFLVSAFGVNRHFTDMPNGAFAVSIVCEALLAGWGIYLVRKAKQPEIEALWDEKWQIPELSESEKHAADQS